MKNVIVICFLFCLCLIMSSCFPKGDNKNDISLPLVNTKALDENNNAIHQIGCPSGADDDDSSAFGFYRLASIFDNGLNILYTDYSTNKEMFLCARPECMHNNETCQSYVDISAGNAPGLLVNNDQLLLVSPGPVGDSFKPRVEIMNLDGTNRHLVAEFKPNQNIGTGRFCADNEHIYFIMEEYNQDGRYTRSLCSLHLLTGKKTEYIQFGEYDCIIDGKDHSLFVQCYAIQNLDSSPSYVPSPVDNNVYFNITKYSIVKVDLDHPNKKVLCEEWSEDRFSFMLNGMYYYYDPTTRYIYKKDFIQDVCHCVKIPDEYSFNFPYIQATIENKLIVDAFVDDKNETRNLFSIDFDSKEIQTMPFRNNWGRAISICGIYEDCVFVQYEISESTFNTEYEGVMSEITKYIKKMGCLNLCDFFDGNPNYIPTEMIN